MKAMSEQTVSAIQGYLNEVFGTNGIVVGYQPTPQMHAFDLKMTDRRVSQDEVWVELKSLLDEAGLRGFSHD